MRNRREGVGAIVFDETNGDSEGYIFLILHRILNWTGWEFPKGGTDGEGLENALKRELEEETGITDFKIIKKLDKKLEFENPKRNQFHSNTIFLVKADSRQEINLDQDIIEHDAYMWADEKTVLEKLHFEDTKEVFREALKELKKIG